MNPASRSSTRSSSSHDGATAAHFRKTRSDGFDRALLPLVPLVSPKRGCAGGGRLGTSGCQTPINGDSRLCAWRSHTSHEAPRTVLVRSSLPQMFCSSIDARHFGDTCVTQATMHIIHAMKVKMPEMMRERLESSVRANAYTSITIKHRGGGVATYSIRYSE